MKDRPIRVDVDNGFFVKTEPIKKKRKVGKSGLLLAEAIQMDIYKAKCGFTTPRPLAWAVAMESLIARESQTTCRWQYRVENEIFTECRLLFYFEATKKVEINIYIRTGVIMIQGQYHEWSEKIFPILKDDVNSIDNVYDIIAESKPTHAHDTGAETETAKVETLSGSVENIENIKDLDCLWEENVTLKNALTCLQEDYAVLKSEFHGMKNSMEEKLSQYAEKIRELERSYDTKLEVFLKTNSEDCDKKMESKLKSRTDISAHNRKEIDGIKSTMYKKLEKIENEIINDSKGNFENSPAWTYLSKVEERYILHQTQAASSYQNSLEYLTSKVDKLETECTSLKTQQGKTMNEQNIVTHNVSSMKRDIDEIRRSKVSYPSVICPSSRESR